MKATIYIPFANGDAVNGFRYEGRDIKGAEYAKMENDEYYEHRDGVDQMVGNCLGNNIAYNPYQKRVINAKSQSYAFHKCEGNIRNINGSDVTTAQLDRLWANKEQFGLYIYLNEQDFLRKPDLETDLKMWVKDSLKILNLQQLPDEEKLKHLPKKDFKMDIDDGNSHIILQDCKFMKLLSNARKPVTRRCNVCGYTNETEKRITEWTCPKCGTTFIGEPLIGSFGLIGKRIIFTKK